MNPSGEPSGNGRVLAMAFAAFSLGFGIWAMFSALGPFLIKWYGFSPSKALLLAAMPPLFAGLVSIPLGIAADFFGGRKVFSALMVFLALPLLAATVADSYPAFIAIGMLLGLGGASFVVGNTHVSVWYPQSRQGTALGLFAMGNVGIVIGMVLVPFLIVHVLGGPPGFAALPAKVTLGPLGGWRLIFPVFAVLAVIAGILYWNLTSEPPERRRGPRLAEIVEVYSKNRLAWIIAYLYWASFGTLTFFSSFTPTYLSGRWGVDGAQASMIYASGIVICVAAMRPVGGWLSDRTDPRRVLAYLFGTSLGLVLLLAAELSFPVQIGSMFGLALLSGAAAACVVKLIPTYFKQVGAVSGLAKASGAICGFTMTSVMALTRNATGGYALGFGIWAAMTAVALLLALSPAPFRKTVSIRPVAAPAPEPIRGV